MKFPLPNGPWTTPIRLGVAHIPKFYDVPNCLYIFGIVLNSSGKGPQSKPEDCNVSSAPDGTLTMATGTYVAILEHLEGERSPYNFWPVSGMLSDKPDPELPTKFDKVRTWNDPLLEGSDFYPPIGDLEKDYHPKVDWHMFPNCGMEFPKINLDVEMPSGLWIDQSPGAGKSHTVDPRLDSFMEAVKDLPFEDGDTIPPQTYQVIRKPQIERVYHFTNAELYKEQIEKYSTPIQVGDPELTFINDLETRSLDPDPFSTPLDKYDDPEGLAGTTPERDDSGPIEIAEWEGMR